MEENFKIGNFICELRKEKGLSQSELGALLNVTNKAVSRWETGRGLPDSSLLIPLSEALGVTADEILRGELSISAVILKGEPPTSEPVAKTNSTLAYRAAKKLLIRDSIIVLPIISFIFVWLLLVLGLDVDLSFGADYFTMMMVNLIIPLLLIGAGQYVYAMFLIGDTLKLEHKNVFIKIFAVIAVWLAVNNLFLLVYIRRIAIFFKSRKTYRTK